MEIACYICDKPFDIDRLVNHLRGHSDSETRMAYQRIIKGRKPSKKKGKEDGHV